MGKGDNRQWENPLCLLGFEPAFLYILPERRPLPYRGHEGTLLAGLKMWARSSRVTQTTPTFLDHVQGARGGKSEPVVLCTSFEDFIQAQV